MINWNFDSNDYTEQSFKPIPVGDHRVRIAKAVEEISKSSNLPMITLVLEVSGYSSKIWHYLTLNPEKREQTNQRLGELFNSFGIQQGNFNLQSWVGKVGAAKVKHEDYKGEPSAKIAYFINKDRQDKLPAWQDGNNGGNVSAQGFTPVDIDLPFN